MNARTTSYQRTIATLQGVLSGLFPGTQQPITVHTTDEIDEILVSRLLLLGAAAHLLLVLSRRSLPSTARVHISPTNAHPPAHFLCSTQTSSPARSCTCCSRACRRSSKASLAAPACPCCAALPCPFLAQLLPPHPCCIHVPFVSSDASPPPCPQRSTTPGASTSGWRSCSAACGPPWACRMTTGRCEALGWDGCFCKAGFNLLAAPAAALAPSASCACAVPWGSLQGALGGPARCGDHHFDARQGAARRQAPVLCCTGGGGAFCCSSMWQPPGPTQTGWPPLLPAPQP